MTADSIPISELGQAGRWFLAAHVASYKAGIVQLGSDSTIFVFSVHFIVCICVYLSLINEMSHSRHAPLVLQPTSKPGRPHPVIIPYFCQKYSILGCDFAVKLISSSDCLVVALVTRSLYFDFVQYYCKIHPTHSNKETFQKFVVMNKLF